MLNDGNNGLRGLLQSAKKSARNPNADKLSSGIFKAITTGEPDPEGRGRLSAYVPKLGGTPKTPMYFQYASPFGGSNGSSNYGFFAVPPDAGITVMIFFADDGDTNEGFWFSMLQQVPNVTSGGASSTALIDGTGQGEDAYSEQPAQKASITNLDQAQNPEVALWYDEFGDVIEDPTKLDARGNQISPNHPRNTNLANQGTYTDQVRGQTTSTPQRDASYEETQHSRVFGMSTPGQNAITMDDGSTGDDDTIHPSQMRLTTGSGASMVIDGTNDFVYMINSSGSSWAELGADGNISVYGQGSISVRAENDINLRADKNINMEAGERINMRSGSHITTESVGHTNVISGGSQFFDSGGSNHTKVGSNMYVSTGNLLHLNGPQAAAAQKTPLVSHPDIQNMESTELRESILSGMPSHEPSFRVSPAQTGGGNIVPDPNSFSAQSRAANAGLQNEAGAYNDGSSVSSSVVQVGDGEGGEVTYSQWLGKRSMPLNPELLSIITAAAAQCNLNVYIQSAGQVLRGTPGVRVGSTRHDLGFAADIGLKNGSQQLYTNKTADLRMIITFCRTVKSMGVTAIGAGPGYMSSSLIHVDIAAGRNLTPANAGTHWGSNHSWTSAPQWLRDLF